MTRTVGGPRESWASKQAVLVIFGLCCFVGFVEILESTIAGSQLSRFVMRSSLEPTVLNLGESRGLAQIPAILLLTAKSSEKDLPHGVLENLKRTRALNPELKEKWLTDADCPAFIRKHVDQELAVMFDTEPRGSYRGDICRAAALWVYGGFYIDLDVQLFLPLARLIDNSTTFMSAVTSDGSVLNAIIAAVPRSTVMKEVLQQLKAWYRGDAPRRDAQTGSEWMGPITMFRAISEITKRQCKDEYALMHHQNVLQWKCGQEMLRFYQERELNCYGPPRAECPVERRNSEFMGVHFGLFEPGHISKIVAWPRYSSCKDWGCGSGGWTVANR